MNEDLDPARGMALGCIMGSLIWIAIFAIAWLALPGPW